jgi:predicted phosphodiesterase
MKIIAIGDTHGHDNWKDIVKQDFDKVIFIGDYFDSFDVPFEKQMSNFKEILDFKEANVDKVILLIGNHDYHYIMPNTYYSGYQRAFEVQINSILMDALDKGWIQMTTYDGGWLFTHAGVTETWAKHAYIDPKKNRRLYQQVFPEHCGYVSVHGLSECRLVW